MGDPEAPPARRGRVEDQCCIDVSALYNARKLGPGSCCTWSWSRGTSIVGAVNLAVNADAIDIDGYVATGTGIVPVQEVIQIARLPARFANRPCGRTATQCPSRPSYFAPAAGADAGSSTSSPRGVDAGAVTG